jgi:hypothetical protein
MPASKDIVGKIVDFLRQNEEGAEVGIKTAAKFDCHPSIICRALGKLSVLGVVKRVGPGNPRKGHPARYVLDSRFAEGDSWRELFKRGRSRKESKAEPSGAIEPAAQPVAGEADGKCDSEECLNVKKALLGELVGIYEKLKTCQEENQTLRSSLMELQKESAKREQELRDLSDRVEKMRKINFERRAEVEGLEARLKRLRTQTSQPPAGGIAGFDISGCAIMQGEGLPDRS